MGSTAEWRVRGKNQWTGRYNTRITQSEQQKQIEKNKWTESLRDQWNYNKKFNIHVLRATEAEEHRAEDVLKKWWKLPQFGKKPKPIDSRNSNRTNPKESIPSNIIIKLLKTKDKGKNLEGSQRKTTLSVGEKQYE